MTLTQTACFPSCTARTDQNFCTAPPAAGHWNRTPASRHRTMAAPASSSRDVIVDAGPGASHAPGRRRGFRHRIAGRQGRARDGRGARHRRRDRRARSPRRGRPWRSSTWTARPPPRPPPRCPPRPSASPPTSPSSAAGRRAVAEAMRALGPIDVLVNNAGWDKIEPFLDNDESDWDRILRDQPEGPDHRHARRRSTDDRTRLGRDREHRVRRGPRRVQRRGGLLGAKGGVIAFSKTMARSWRARHPRQLRLPRADRHRVARDAWTTSSAPGSSARDPDAPRRPAGGDRAGGRLPGQRRRRLRDRPDPLGQRRPHDGVTASTRGNHEQAATAGTSSCRSASTPTMNDKPVLCRREPPE